LTQIGGVGTSFYDGNVDEVAFWDSDQSLNLNSVYNSGVPNDISSLSPLLWYRMGDSDVYPTISDNAGSNDATMQNMSSSNFVADVPLLFLATLFGGFLSSHFLTIWHYFFPFLVGFFAVFAAALKAFAVGAPFVPGLRIFSPDPDAMRFRLA
jgi:hypothetical protein